MEFWPMKLKFATTFIVGLTILLPKGSRAQDAIYINGKGIFTAISSDTVQIQVTRL